MKKLLLLLASLISFICNLTKSQSCECPPSVYAGQSGVITSPNYPSRYCVDLTCNYFITVPDGQFVKLTFTFYNTYGDDIYIYDGDKTNDDSNLIAQFSGTFEQDNAVFYSGSSKLSVKFVSAHSYQGFTATYQSVTNYCGHTNLNTATGLVLESPNYPNNYPNNVHCLWTITTTQGQMIELTFASANTEPINDQVTILGTDGSVLAQLSGPAANFPQVTTEGNVMRVLFTSDKNVISSGFRAIYRAKDTENSTCQLPRTQSIINPAECKTLSSPHFPYAYSENNNCTWYLTVPENFNVRITFNEFSLKPDVDFVDVFDGVGVSGQPLASCTGTSCPITVSSGTWMTVRFTTYGPVESIGWSATWCPFYVI